MSAIGIFLKNKRLEAGYTQKRLAQESGLKHDSVICRLETGLQKPSWEELGNISMVLKNFHPFEALKVAGFITDDDINPQHKLHHLEDLTTDELDKLQEVIDFFLHRRKQKRG